LSCKTETVLTSTRLQRLSAVAFFVAAVTLLWLGFAGVGRPIGVSRPHRQGLLLLGLECMHA
jgi:hypothetical protein